MPETKRTASGVFGGLLGLVGLSAAAGVLITATVTPAIAVSGAAATSAITMFDNLPSVLDIDKLMLPTTFYYTNPDTGEALELTSFYDQNRSPVEFDQVAPVMYDAVLSSEDPRFYQHGGVDLIGTSRAVLQNLRGGGETQGGSSISQQYVKNVLIQRCERDAVATEELTEAEVLANCWTQATTASGNEGIERKLQEMRYAIALEQKYSKNDILLGYLNIANFGGRTYGIDAAAKYYFGATASTLTLSQAATLAGIVQNPNTYRIDQPEGSIWDEDGVGYNKAPDGLVDDVGEGRLAALDTLLAEGTITQEQYLVAADGYSVTKGRQLYVLSRLLDDRKITRDEYVAAALEPITPVITPPTTGCAAAGGAAYYCQYVKNTILADPAFGATLDDRYRTLQRGGLNIYTTLDPRLQATTEQTMRDWTPTSMEGLTGPETGKFGAATVSIDNATGRVLAIGQNTVFSEDAALAADPNYSSLVYAGDRTYGKSDGFNAGSTFKLFTLIDWLEQGHSVNEVLNGVNRVFPRMTNSCTGDWVNVERAKIGNFGQVSGFTGTPLQFTAASLNSGYLAMASELDLCDIANVATKMGVTTGDGRPISMAVANNVIGDDNVAPIAMAGAYGTVANNGVYCQPKVIDRVTDSDGVERPELVPVRTSTPVLDPEVASTAAYALEGVMRGGGTGSQANPGNAPVIGKTGTHEGWQSWMIESSTKVVTAAWVGNSTGTANIFEMSYADRRVSDLRYVIAESIQYRANELYGGDRFPENFGELTRQVTRDLPSVIGLSVDEATARLEDAGFNVNVGEPVDSAEAEGVVAAQNPGAGRAAGGTTVTINPSNGQGISVPDVAGKQLDRALSDLRGAGFGNVQPGACTEDTTAGPQGKATGTTPAAGSIVNRNSAITVDYSRAKCT
jgi:membrane peptidoglycan carboxypeptidase